MREREIELRANGLRFVAHEYSDPKAAEAEHAPIVLCLHGFPDHARSFRHQVAPLVEAGYRVVTPYMRGYAPTERPADGNYQTAALGRDVIGLIDALEVERAVVVGHDWGALAAYAAAARAPQRISKLVSAAVPYGLAFLTRFLSDHEQLKRSWYVYFFQTPVADGVVAADHCAFVRNVWQDWCPTWRLPDEEVDAVRDTIAKAGGVEAAIGYYRSMLSGAGADPALADEQAKLHAVPIEVPTLYVHGDCDGCMHHSLADGMESMFPAGLRKEVVIGAGHFLHQEKPELFNRLLLEFLA
jgi:pimeloyl-ACP methyl ester carboxylesterase